MRCLIRQLVFCATVLLTLPGVAGLTNPTLAVISVLGLAKKDIHVLAP